MKSKMLLSVLAASMVLLTACGSNSNEPANSPASSSTGSPATSEASQPPEEKKAVTVSMMTAQGKYKEQYKLWVDKLKAEENITLDIQVVPDDQYETLIKTKIATDEVPDIFMHNASVGEYQIVKADTKMVDLSNEPWVSRLANPEIIKSADGKIYALPQESSSFYAALYYNKKVFADLGLQEPATYADFLNILETVKTKGNGITPIFMSNKDTWTTQIFVTAAFPQALAEKGQETWGNLLTNKVKWADIPEFKQALTDYQDLFRKGYVNKDHVTATFDNAKEALASGKAAMMLNGEWTVGDLLSKNQMKPEDIGAFPIPYMDKQLMATGAYVQGFFIPKAAKNVEDAKRVLNLISQPAYMDLVFAAHPGSPGFTDVNGGEVHPAVKGLFDNYIATNKYVSQLNDPMGIAGPIFGDLWKLYVDMAVDGGKTPDEVVAAWDKIYTDFMKQKEQPGF
ncbi:ABC transporter substrate-binding protein [Cohnella herbarum]|uniref:Extracellular solute-binding protein n=1 Tax=Cohnella herbarum TaxID=2728023 RepID=A0A7Z2VNZ1_9BACL|nr:extracellular solute-binding protein [Cohnella herbarum]QJD86429.1 extracellular solute-binding protein [Cohnella herbarum]